MGMRDIEIGSARKDVKLALFEIERGNPHLALLLLKTAVKTLNAVRGLTNPPKNSHGLIMDKTMAWNRKGRKTCRSGQWSMKGV
jgi:hypothetical protein